MAASLPRFAPLKLHRIAEPFNHPDWVFELKYDGFRSIARIVGRSGAVDRPGTSTGLMGGHTPCTSELRRARIEHVGGNMQDESQSFSGEAHQGTETKSRTRRAQSEAYNHSEGPVARQIEDQTARLPSDVFLWAALGTMAVAATVQFLERKQWSLFLGQWAAPLLLFGLYNKVVKVAGSDRIHSGDGTGSSW